MRDSMRKAMRPVPASSFAVRTNVLDDGVLSFILLPLYMVGSHPSHFFTPNIGLEWSFTPYTSVLLNVGYFHCGSTNGVLRHVRTFNPELRYYLRQGSSWFIGLSGGIKEFDIYQPNLGLASAIEQIWEGVSGENGSGWKLGTVFGYRRMFGSKRAVDFNLVYGYRYKKYDCFKIEDGRRTYIERDVTDHSWGVNKVELSYIYYM